MFPFSVEREGTCRAPLGTIGRAASLDTPPPVGQGQGEGQEGEEGAEEVREEGQVEEQEERADLPPTYSQLDLGSSPPRYSQLVGGGEEGGGGGGGGAGGGWEQENKP